MSKDYPRSLDLLCADAWEHGYQSAVHDAGLATEPAEKTANPYSARFDEE